MGSRSWSDGISILSDGDQGGLDAFEFWFFGSVILKVPIIIIGELDQEVDFFQVLGDLVDDGFYVGPRLSLELTEQYSLSDGGGSLHDLDLEGSYSPLQVETISREFSFEEQGLQVHFDGGEILEDELLELLGSVEILFLLVSGGALVLCAVRAYI